MTADAGALIIPVDHIVQVVFKIIIVWCDVISIISNDVVVAKKREIVFVVGNEFDGGKVDLGIGDGVDIMGML